MEKTVVIENKTYRMRASALIPRLYRAQFGRDLIADMRSTRSAQPPNAADHARSIDLTVFEDLAWLMMHHAGEDVGDSPEEWLASLDGMFSTYEILPAVLALWNENQRTTSTAKKK